MPPRCQEASHEPPKGSWKGIKGGVRGEGVPEIERRRWE